MRYSLRTTQNYRRMLAISAALLASGYFGPALGQSDVMATLSAAQCTPLTENNYERCCAALNRASILTPQQSSQCPPLSTSVFESAADRERGEGVGGNGGNGGGGNGGGGNGGGGGGNVNSGPGNGGEGAAGEHGDRDPGRSGEHNNAPDTPGGR